MEQELEFFEEQDVLLEKSNPSEEWILKVRLDKWLWAARFFKTRALARVAVEAGKVYYNGERPRPGREVEIGALLQIAQGPFEKTILIKGLSTRRRSTEEALQLFEETKQSDPTREQFEYHPQSTRNQPNVQFSTRPEQNQKRPVRFLRRSFMRADPHHHRNDRPSQNNSSIPTKEVEYWE